MSEAKSVVILKNAAGDTVQNTGVKIEVGVEAMYPLLLRNMQVGVALHEMQYADDGDAVDYRFLDMNPAYERLTHLSRDVVGRLASEVFSIGVPPYLDIYERVVSSATPLQYEAYFPDSGRYFAVSVFALAPQVFGTVLNETTESKRLEQTLWDIKEGYHRLYNNAQVGLFCLRIVDGRVIECNERFARLFGYASREELMVDFDMARQYMEPGDWVQLLTALHTNRDIPDCDARFSRRDGALLWTRFTARLSADDQFIEGCVIDISSEKVAEVRLRESMAHLKAALDGTVNALSKTAARRDPYTAGHQQRVAFLACAIAREMQCTDAEIEAIRIAGLLHDIGKIAVPIEILCKPGKISENEFNLIKAHCEVGFEILQDIEFPWPIAQIVLQHHRRLNGEGYPEATLAEEVELPARILGVADVVEAISSHRPYRPALGIAAALEEVSHYAGSLYDPAVVAACLRLFEQGFTFEQI